MQYCPKCKINIHGNKRCCPLCQGLLQGEPEDQPFPALPAPKFSRMSAVRLAAFVWICVEVCILLTAFLVPGDHTWSAVAFGTAALAFLDTYVVLMNRHNVIRLVNLQVYLVLFVCLAIYLISGRHDWGFVLSWQIPICLSALLLTTFLIGLLSRRSIDTYMVYMLVNILLSFLQVIPILSGTNAFPLPAAISMALLFLSGAALLLFRPAEFRSGLVKWFRL